MVTTQASAPVGAGPTGTAGVVRPPKAGRRPVSKHGRGAIVLFLAPYVVLFLIFRILPTLAGFVLSLTKYQITGVARWNGISNFTRLFTDGLFWNALRVTAVYTVISVPLTLIVSLAMAQLAARSIRGIKVYRALYFLPVITSLVTTGVIWQWIYGEHGPLNSFLSAIGLGGLPWLSSGSLVLPSLSLISIWTRFGYDMLILLAGLLAIPHDYTEAAMLDGASALQRYRHVTLPLLKPAIFLVLILEIVQSFQIFDVIYVMTGGGPVRSSYSLVFLIYDQGFHYFDFGYASAAGVVLFVITLGVSLIQRRLFRED